MTDLDKRFPRSPVADLMRDPDGHVPEMLIPGWLQKGVLHWVQGPPEEGKSWKILWDVAWVLNSGGTVLLADEELGRRRVAERLAWLGVTPEVVEERLHHVEFPTLTEADVRAWAEFVERDQFDLVVFETGTDFLAIAGASENAGDAVTAWIKDFPERAARTGAAVIVSDHVGKNGDSGGFAVGTRAKRSKAKIVFEFSAKEPFGRDKIGRVEVTTYKNTDDAPSVGLRGTVRHLRMGGKDGAFVLQDLTVAERKKQKDEDVRADKDFQAHVVSVLKTSDKVCMGRDALLDTARAAGLKGSQQHWQDKLKEYVASPVIPVEHNKTGAARGYFHRDRGPGKAS